MTIGDRIKSRRKAMVMTQEELAKRVRVARTTLVKYENGDIRQIPMEVIQKLAVSLDCDVKYLLGWDDRIEDFALEDTKEADPNIAKITRVAERMTAEQRVELLKFCKYMFPEAFIADVR